MENGGPRFPFTENRTNCVKGLVPLLCRAVAKRLLNWLSLWHDFISGTPFEGVLSPYGLRPQGVVRPR